MDDWIVKERQDPGGVGEERTRGGWRNFLIVVINNLESAKA